MFQCYVLEAGESKFKELSALMLEVESRQSSIGRRLAGFRTDEQQKVTEG